VFSDGSTAFTSLVLAMFPSSGHVGMFGLDFGCVKGIYFIVLNQITESHMKTGVKSSASAIELRRQGAKIATKNQKNDVLPRRRAEAAPPPAVIEQ
jgi:hypothetical protein